MIQTRHIAISMLDKAIREGTPPELLEVKKFTNKQVSPEDERFIRAMVLMTLRHLGQIDALIDMTLDKPLPKGKHWVKCAIRIGLAQSALMRVPAHAAVHATVQAIKQSKFRGLASLANFVLRKHTGSAPSLPHSVYNVPDWIRERWNRTYGAETVQHIARAAEKIPPIDVHYIRETTTPEDAVLLTEGHYRVPDNTEIPTLAGYEEGAFFVQDIAASYPVRMLGDVAGLTVLEIGASPGGKTAQLCAHGAEVTALDKSQSRMEVLFANLERLKLHPGIMVMDVFAFETQEQYDRVVIDAPCTATGTWRRHPEVLHLLEPNEIEELATIQRDMLRKGWSWVKPGGRMLFCTCSLELEEGEAHIENFLKVAKDARIAPIANPEQFPSDAIHADGYLRTHPAMRIEDGGMDGFFAVIFEKIA